MNCKNILAAFFLALISCADLFAVNACDPAVPDASGFCGDGCKVFLSTCDMCDLGTYKSGLSAAAGCTTCPAGQYCSGKGNSAPTGYCANGYWCPAGSQTNHGDTGDGSGEHQCPAPYNSNSGSGDNGAKSEDDCYLLVSAGKWVASAGAGEEPCAPNHYCIGGYKIYKGGGGNGYSFGGLTNCPAEYSQSDAGANGIWWCYTTCAAGTYWNATSRRCENCTNSNATGKWCPGGKVYQGGTNNAVQNDCTNVHVNGAYSGTGGATNNCPWGSSCGLDGSGYYWNNSIRDCSKCPKGYYCPGVSVSDNISADAGKYPCGFGATTDADGQADQTACKMKAGSSGTKFCDKNGCFNLPVDIPYQ